MNYVPDKFKNVINPWQTLREIKAQTRFLVKMLLKLALSPEDEYTLLNLGKDRKW